MPRTAARPGIEHRVLDVRDGDAVQALVQGLGELDVVVNCAGIIRRGAEHEPEAFARTVDINLNGTMRVCAAARPGLAARRGCIVNTASMLSFFGGGLVPGYSASKGGVAQLTKSLAIAYAADGIRVNAVAPGWIATPLTQALQDDPARSAPILARTPLGRWGTPEDIAGPVLFLASAGGALRHRRGAAGGRRLSDHLKEGTAMTILQLPGIQPEIAIPAIPEDERVWVPQAPLVWFRPLLLNTVTGSWCNLLRVRKSGVLSRHIHPSWVTGYVIRGAWRYLEHDWVAREGSFVYEPPGEIHTLVVDEAAGGATEMITFFNIHGAMVYVDEAGQTTGYEDVFTKIEMCRSHYTEVGLGADYVDQFVR